MKILIIGNPARYEKFMPQTDFARGAEKVFAKLTASVPEMLAAAGDAGVIFADAVTPVTKDLIDGMPNLKLIHSEGVAYNRIDVQAAAARGIPVCNCRGINASPVAEQAVLLMLGLLRTVVPGEAAVRAGRQMETKEHLMVAGIRELADCTVGLVGFGAIAKETAGRLTAFGCRVLYWNRTRRPADEEAAYGVTYAPLDELLPQCDIVSLHLAVTPETTHIANAAFLAKMRPDALLINTARGELVDNDALYAALQNGVIAGAGLDTIAPEPVPADHVLLGLEPEKLLLSPHIGGVTTSTFRRGHALMWQAAQDIAEGKEPKNRVN